MSLSTKQKKFTWMVHLLIQYAYKNGYELTFGDVWSQPEHKTHKKNSFHFKRLAVDFNLFKDGKYLKASDDYKELGEYWENIGGTWGGRFRNVDGNHFSLGE